MTKAIKYWVLAIIMALLALVEAISGFVLWLGFTTRQGGGHGLGGGLGNLTFWELSRHTWIDIHDWVAVALVILVCVHVILHWKWIVRVAKSGFVIRKLKMLSSVLVKSNE
jgi:hypothetical protein